jgi:hypothetical protein
MVCDTPGVIEAKEQDTVPVPPTGGVVQLPLLRIDWKVVPDGRLSMTVTLVAAFGPRLVTVMVYVTFWPTWTGSGESAIRIRISAVCPPFWTSVVSTSKLESDRYRIR